MAIAPLVLRYVIACHVRFVAVSCIVCDLGHISVCLILADGNDDEAKQDY